jgi:anthranilate phosphoribosyltransferase
MIKEEIQQIISKHDLTFDESYQVMNNIMNGQVNNSHIAGLLVALKSKGESSDEVGGFVKAMRENSIKVDNGLDSIDVCGTGGDNSNTFNISTAVAFVVAGAGVKVAKHGNRSISSNSGSSDVLTKLGVNINLTKEQSEKALADIGITFLFAPNYHPAMKYVMPVRRELGFKTVFNILGPLTNPANSKKQMIGTFNYEVSELMREAVRNLEMERVCFICTNNSFDEITLGGTTKVFEYDKVKGNSEFEVSAETFKYPEINISELSCDGPDESAKIIMNILEGKDIGPKRNVVIANSAMALYSANFSDDLIKCKLAAEESIVSGKALDKLIQLRDYEGSIK